MTKTRDIAPIFGDAYSRSAPRVLGDQHSYMLDRLMEFSKDKPRINHLVLGCSGQALPYSCSYTKDGKLGESGKDNVRSIIKGGSLVLLDYIIEEEKQGLKKAMKIFDTMGFFDKNYFLNNGITDSLENITALNSGIYFLHNNLRTDIRINDRIVDSIDANLSIHHASVTRDELKRVYAEAYRILKDDGVLFLGEGNVNMNYTEDKLIKLGVDLTRIINGSVSIADNRESESGFVLNSFFELGMNYTNLPSVKKEKTSQLNVKVDKYGIISFDYDDLNQIPEQLRKLGYTGIERKNDKISMPLIDQNNDLDKKFHIDGVNSFYDAIIDRVEIGYRGIDDVLADTIIKGINYERGNAARGIVEYYMGKDKVLNALDSVGFKHIDIKHHKEPFYNIVAYK